MDRRYFLQTAAVLGSLGFFRPAAGEAATEGLSSSELVYLTPIKSNGEESRCQAEIWFVYDGAAVYVCTRSESWRAQAPALSLASTRIWVGDLGQWQDTEGKYKSLPTMMAQASIEYDQQEHKRVLELFGDKYGLAWLAWGPRFRKGLADGSRTLIKYRPA
ncbi:MAG: hypothetical protein ACJAX5_001085 [Patiriisocius sp.]|jgi:hypothetical protein